MIDVYLVIDAVVVFTLAGLGLTVFIKNRLLTLNRAFACFSISVGIWIFANYISNTISYAPTVAWVANFFVFGFSFFASLFLLKFVILLAKDPVALKVFNRVQPLLVVTGLVGASPLVVAGVRRQGEVYAVIFGPLLLVYATVLLAMLLWLLWIARVNIKSAKGALRSQLTLFYATYVLSLPAVILMQFIIPTVTGWFGLTNLGIFPMLILVYGLYYGVIKRRLFDLRPIFLRGTAYILSIAALAGGFILVSNYFKQLIDTNHGETVANVLNLALIAAVLLVYSPTRKFFDKITDRFFFRDAYEPQALFDQLNKMLVSSLDIHYLMTQSISIIETAVRPDFALIGLRDGLANQRLYQSRKIQFDETDLAAVRKLTVHLRRKVIVTDYLDDARHSELKEVLVKNNIAALVRLSQNLHSNEEGLGYLMLGVKKSGNPYTPQDVRVLDTVANELIIAIQNALHYEEIQQFNVQLQAKVDEATRKLRRTNEKLKQLDEAKDDFVSMASHQLRTPLTSIKGYTSMVLEGDAGRINATQRKLLEQSFMSSQRMVYLIADLLNVSRLKTGKFIIEQRPVNLAEVVEQEIVQLKETAAGRSLELTYEKPDSFPDLMLDETKTRQVIMNFVDNAIYYTPAGGHIAVKLVETPASVELRVVDDGIGVPKSEQPHLFTKFYRAGNARTARPDGTGLGLFMAKKVIVAEGGALLFETQEGKGSTFGFVFGKNKLAPGEYGALPAEPATTTAASHR